MKWTTSEWTIIKSIYKQCDKNGNEEVILVGCTDNLSNRTVFHVEGYDVLPGKIFDKFLSIVEGDVVQFAKDANGKIKDVEIIKNTGDWKLFSYKELPTQTHHTILVRTESK